MKKLILFLSIFSAGQVAAQHTLNWAEQMVPATASSGITSKKIAVDASGNVYTTGEFSGQVDFDPGPGIFNLNTPTGSGGGNIFISKLTANGDFVWAKQFTGTIYMYANALAVSPAGDVYVGGTFNNTVDFDPGSGTAYLTATSPSDIFICRLTSAGDFVWVKHIGADDSQSVLAMEFAHDGGLLLTGYGDPLTDYDPGAPVVNINDDGYLLKLTSSGDFVWVTAIAHTGQAIDVESDGTILQLGDDMNFISLNKLDASGNLLWSKTFNGGYMSAGDVTHGPAGDIYVSGNFESTISWGSASNETLNATNMRDAFIIHFDQSGTTLDAWQFEGTGYNTLNSLQFNNGSLTAAGYFSGPTDFDPGAGTITVNSTQPGWSDVVLLTLSPSGTVECLSTIGSTQPDYPSSMVFTSQGNFLVTGTVGDTADFDPGAGTAMLNYGSNFIAMYESCIAAGINEANSQQPLFCQPNPASNSFIVSANGEWQLQVYTIEGRLVKQVERSEMQEVDVSDLVSGIYTVSLFRDNKVIHQKMVISR
ncbi:MAG TPA: T9SS type A sorting domain-containing protein [Bacteroidia bacterium]|jgi:hypothetical protein